MSEEERFLVFLSQFDLGVKKIKQILSQMENVSIDAFMNMKNLDKILPSDKIEFIKERASERNVNQYFVNLKEKRIGIVTRYSDNFPYKLLSLEDAPYYLFYKGDLSLCDEKSVGIVGTRSPSNYGKIITDRYASELSRSGLVIVSGLAYGVDSISHRKALEEGGKTIAVLGGGFNHIYPPQHTDLAKEIAEKGLLLSEYCPSLKATKYTFPQRNRIIAGLSDALLITEAGTKSGTTHTRDFALEYGKDVFAVPGNITSEKSALTNEIIKSCQGACTTEPKDILSALNVKGGQTKKVLQLGIIEEKIVEILKNGEKDIDFISQNCNLNINSLNSYLTTMEINGIIRRMPGGYYCLA